MADEKIELRIDVFTPGTLPMSRLADYLKQFAIMIGSEENVHFSKVCEGSVALLADIEPQAIPSVRARAQSVADGTAPKPALKAFAAVDALLLEDNAIGEVFIGKKR